LRGGIVSVMILARDNRNLPFSYFINKPVLFVDTPGPISGKFMFERFGLAGTVKGIAHHFRDERIEPPKNTGVFPLPVTVLFKGILAKQNVHTRKVSAGTATRLRP